MQENKFKLVCLDVDGTLVNDQKEIGSFTIAEIQRLSRDASVLFVLVSSRMPKSLSLLMRQLELRGPVIAYNGALVLRDAGFASNGEILQSVFLPAGVLPVVRSVTQTFGVEAHLGIFSDNLWSVASSDYWALRESRGTRIWPDVRPIEKDGNSLIHADKLHKIMVRGDKPVLDEIEKELVLSIPEACEMFRSKGTYLEISPSLAPKSNAISIIQKLFDVAASETMAFGDNVNDIGMLQAAGLGVAMDNAPIEVKRHCKFVTLSNNEDGVGYGLRKFFPV